MLISREKASELRQILIDAMQDRAQSGDEVNWHKLINKFKLVAKDIKNELPKYFELKIDDLLFQTNQEMNAVFKQGHPLQESELETRMSEMLRRLVYLLDFMLSHNNFEAIDERDSENMKNNFRHIKMGGGRKYLDCVGEMASILAEIKLLEQYIDRDFSPTM